MAKPGYGYAHQQERKRAIAVMVDGTLCPFCHKPMTKRMLLDYDHAVPIALGGMDGVKRLSHRHCNRSVGATIGNAMRSANFTLRRKGTPERGSPSKRLPRW